MTSIRGIPAAAVALFALTACGPAAAPAGPGGQLVASPSPSPSPSPSAGAGAAPTGVVVPTPALPKTTAPAPKKTTTKPAAPKTTKPASVYYASCDAVRAAGAAPLYRGQPGYRAGLDRDDDGVACET